MSNSQKLVLMIQPIKLQGLIWQAVLKSQGLGVIWEAIDFNIEENLDQLEAAGLPLPNFLLIDVGLENFNPYALCRFCRNRYPHVNIILTDGRQREIHSSQRQWAINQGASDFLPGFSRNNLFISVTSQVKRLLQVLDNQTLDNEALNTLLSSIKQKLEASQSTAQGQSKVAEKSTSGNENETGNSPQNENGKSGTENQENPPPKLRRRYRGVSY